MSDASQFNEPKIALAVATDEHAASLVKFAGSLAARLGKRLVLLHVIEPILELPISMVEIGPLHGIEAAAVQESHKAAEQWLADLKKLVPQGVSVESVIVHGKTRSMLAQSALTSRACLLIAGAHFQTLRHAISRGLSTAMGLMPVTRVPLMLVDPNQLPSLTDSDSKILLADDLTPSAEAAVRYALEFSTAIEHATVRHIYINSIDRQQLAGALAAAAAAARAPEVDEVSAESVFARLVGDLRHQLEYRASSYVDYLENSGGNYEADVITGKVREELSVEILRFHPSLLVFGRHKALHAVPIFLGRMPFRAMVAHGLPVLVVPADNAM